MRGRGRIAVESLDFGLEDAQRTTKASSSIGHSLGAKQDGDQDNDDEQLRAA